MLNMEYNQISVIIIYFSGVFFWYCFCTKLSLFILIDYENDKLLFIVNFIVWKN